MSFRFLAPAAAVLLAAAGALASEPTPPSLELEVALGDLGEVRSEGFLLIGSAARGKDLLLFDAARARLSTFREASGASWGNPVAIKGMSEPPRALSVRGSDTAFMDTTGIRIYDAEGTLDIERRFFLPADVIPVKSGWVLSLVNLPHPAKPGKFVARSEFGDGLPPRLVLLSDDLEVSRSGLLSEEGLASASVGAGRGLHLAASRSRVYAAELANYRIYELDFKLRHRATLRQPEWIFEQGTEESIANAASVEDALAETVRQRGREVGPENSDKPKRPPLSAAFKYRTVIRNIAWYPDLDRLLVLLDRGLVGSQPAIDLLDPLTGKGRRFTLVGLARSTVLSQVVVGYRYVWFRSHKGDTPTFRLDKLALLEGGLEFELPDVTLLGEDEFSKELEKDFLEEAKTPKE